MRLYPMRVPGEWMNASVDAPRLREPRDVAARQPRVHVADELVVLVVQSTMPMQFGPSSAIPWRIAMSRTSRCIGGGLAALDHAAARDHEVGTPASAASCANRAARSGFTARITVSGRSGSAVERRVARLAVDLVVAWG